MFCPIRKSIQATKVRDRLIAIAYCLKIKNHAGFSTGMFE